MQYEIFLKVICTLVRQAVALRPRQKGRHFADEMLKLMFFSVNNCIQISLQFVPKDRINNKPPPVQIMTSHYLIHLCSGLET